mgnify:CR=1 FL=1
MMSEALLHSLREQELLWEVLETHIPGAEVPLVRRVVGESLLQHNEVHCPFMGPHKDMCPSVPVRGGDLSLSLSLSLTLTLTVSLSLSLCLSLWFVCSCVHVCARACIYVWML